MKEQEKGEGDADDYVDVDDKNDDGDDDDYESLVKYHISRTILLLTNLNISCKRHQMHITLQLVKDIMTCYL